MIFFVTPKRLHLVQRRGQKRPEEARAAHIVSKVTECQTKSLDGGGGISEVDFALLDQNREQIGILEITNHCRKDVTEFNSPKLSKYRNWEDPQLKWKWLVTVDRPTRKLKALQKPVLEALVDLEKRGIAHVTNWPENYKGCVERIPDELKDHGVMECKAWLPPPQGNGSVDFYEWPQTKSYSMNSLIDEINEVLNLTDIQKKLKGNWDRRELFVWVSPETKAASVLSTNSGDLSSSNRDSTCPPELGNATAVWVAMPGGYRGQLPNVLWRGDTNGWKVLNPRQKVRP